MTITIRCDHFLYTFKPLNLNAHWSNGVYTSVYKIVFKINTKQSMPDSLIYKFLGTCQFHKTVGSDTEIFKHF